MSTIRRVLVRVDAGAEIGLGHLSRSLVLADELARRGYKPLIVGWLAAGADAVDSRRYRRLALDAAGEWGIDRAGVSRYIAAPSHGGLAILDTYALGEEWLKVVRAKGARVLTLDDNPGRHLPCDLVVNAAAGVVQAEYRGLIARSTTVLLGPRYALLAREFARDDEPNRRVGPVERVLVSMGGSDPPNMTATAVEGVRRALPAVQIDVVIGPGYAHPLAWSKTDVATHRSVSSDGMASLLRTADMAIGAAGVSAYERCAVGLPSVLVQNATNQERMTSGLVEAGAALVARRGLDATAVDIADAAAALAADRARRKSMSANAAAMVDGLGAVRVAHHLEGVRVRRANRNDLRTLHMWRNDPGTRAASFDERPISIDEHRKWFLDRLEDPHSLIFIGHNSLGPLGVVRLDRSSEQVEVAITVAPEHRGTVGGLLLRACIRSSRRWTGGRRIVAFVRPDNPISRRLFESARFRRVAKNADRLRYELIDGVEVGS